MGAEGSHERNKMTTQQALSHLQSLRGSKGTSVSYEEHVGDWAGSKQQFHLWLVNDETFTVLAYSSTSWEDAFEQLERVC